jgi:hypothetical protein
MYTSIKPDVLMAPGIPGSWKYTSEGPVIKFFASIVLVTTLMPSSELTPQDKKGRHWARKGLT